LHVYIITYPSKTRAVSSKASIPTIFRVTYSKTNAIHYKILILQDSTNKAKLGTFSPWFQWNCLFPPLRRSLANGSQNLFTSNILFLPYSHIKSSLVPEFAIQYFIPNLLFASLFKIVEQHDCYVKDRGTCGSRKEA